MLPLTLLFLSPLLFQTTYAGSNSTGQGCSQTDNGLEVGTYQFESDCDATSYCGSDGTCHDKGCRKDIFPFGYAQGASLPPLCSNGQFCPDEADACQSLLAVGSPCQLNRDDECQPPPDANKLSSDQYLNFNGAVCLNLICTWANVTVGQTCQVENTAYIVYGADDEENIDIVSRGNCAPGLYCDSQQLTCLQTVDVGESCSADKECTSYNCLDTKVCGDDLNAPSQFSIWVYIVVCVGIFGGLFGAMVFLFFVHRREREHEREKRMQYWREQNAFRQNIMQLRDATRGSFMSLPNGGGADSQRSTLYDRREGSDDSHIPMLQHASPKASGLRNNVLDDGIDDYAQGYSDIEPIRSPRAF